MSAEQHKATESEGHQAPPADRPKKTVTVTVDNKIFRVSEGNYVVSQFKEVVGVDAARELDEVLHGELKPLNDNETIHIRGGEVFISHARSGGSS